MDRRSDIVRIDGRHPIGDIRRYSTAHLYKINNGKLKIRIQLKCDRRNNCET